MNRHWPKGYVVCRLVSRHSVVKPIGPRPFWPWPRRMFWLLEIRARCMQVQRSTFPWWWCGVAPRPHWAWGLGNRIRQPFNWSPKNHCGHALAADWATGAGIQSLVSSGCPLSESWPESTGCSIKQRLEFGGVFRGHFPCENQPQLTPAQRTFKPRLFFFCFRHQFGHTNGRTQLVHGHKRVHGLV